MLKPKFTYCCGDGGLRPCAYTYVYLLLWRWWVETLCLHLCLPIAVEMVGWDPVLELEFTYCCGDGGLRPFAWTWVYLLLWGWWVETLCLDLSLPIAVETVGWDHLLKPKFTYCCGDGGLRPFAWTWVYLLLWRWWVDTLCLNLSLPIAVEMVGGYPVLKPKFTYCCGDGGWEPFA